MSMLSSNSFLLMAMFVRKPLAPNNGIPDWRWLKPLNIYYLLNKNCLSVGPAAQGCHQGPRFLPSFCSAIFSNSLFIFWLISSWHSLRHYNIHHQSRKKGNKEDHLTLVSDFSLSLGFFQNFLISLLKR